MLSARDPCQRRIPDVTTSERPAADGQRTVIAASGDGVVEYTLTARAGALSVQRSQRRPDGGRVVQSMRFADTESFEQWCGKDELRFAYPLLYANLKRSARELIGILP